MPIEHEIMVKHFNWHKSNGRIATATVIDEISSFKYRKGNGHRANFKGHPGKDMQQMQYISSTKRMPSMGHRNVSSVETKIILVHVVGPGTENIP